MVGSSSNPKALPRQSYYANFEVAFGRKTFFQKLHEGRKRGFSQTLWGISCGFWRGVEAPTPQALEGARRAEAGNLNWIFEFLVVEGWGRKNGGNSRGSPFSAAFVFYIDLSFVFESNVNPPTLRKVSKRAVSSWL